jgi:hypothetical protein
MDSNLNGNKNNIEKNLKSESELANEQINEEQKYNGGDELSAEEKKLAFFFNGCYSDDPENPLLKKKLGTVRNQLECIKLGQANNLKYVGLEGGNNCMGSNDNKFMQMQKIPKKKCDIVCDDDNTGYCGGSYSTQIYSTDILDHFFSTDTELKQINNNISQSDMVCTLPLNKYILLVSLLIIVLLIYMILEHMNKQ